MSLGATGGLCGMEPSRRLMLYSLLSLDGVAEDPGHTWLSDTGPELFEFLGDTIARQDDVLLGRVTYDEWAGYWPTATLEPFASFINGVRKHVVTASEPSQRWANTVVVSEPVAGYVSALKAGGGGDIGVHGSIRLAQTLVRAGLVDELRLVVAPTLAGRGRRLFDDDAETQPLELVSLDRSAKGTLFLHYRRI